MSDEDLVALRLAKEGFGTMTEILEMPADQVLNALEYCGFLSDYQDTYMNLNRENEK